jgi:peptide/nickel transport system permease protein
VLIWLLRRTLQAVLVMLAMTVLVFVGVNVIGNPIDIMISPDATQEIRQQAIQALGFDKPLWSQYLTFLLNAAHGDIGNSYVFNEPALDVIMQRLPATLELAFAALILSVVIGIPLGLFAGMYADHPLSRFIMAGSILGFSLPSFWVGLMFIMVFSVMLGWLPSIGRGETVEIFGMRWSFLTRDGLAHMLLPAINLALYKISMVLRLTRAGVRETMHTEFIKFARAKGLAPSRIIGVHLLKNIMIPVVTMVGLGFGGTIAFAVVTETVFAWPGTGKLIIDSISVLDRPVIVAYLMMIVTIFVIINLLVDVSYTLLDPRVRLEDRE